MGAWGIGPFEDDNALDFLDELIEKPSWELVRHALQTALSSTYLEAPEASDAVAAVAILIEARKPDLILGQIFPGKRRRLVKALGSVPADLPSLARGALRKIRDGSELAELWAQTKRNEKWRAMLSKLERGLA